VGSSSAAIQNGHAQLVEEAVPRRQRSQRSQICRDGAGRSTYHCDDDAEHISEHHWLRRPGIGIAFCEQGMLLPFDQPVADQSERSSENY